MKPKNYFNDIYQKLAKIEGYRSRAAFKLIQINDKFDILNRKKNILDLGCAPGSWIQVIIKKLNLKDNLKIVGVDIRNMKPIKNVIFIKSDVFSDDIILKINELYPNGIDLILSDMAPNITGNKYYDSANAQALLDRSFFIAKKFLIQGGDYVAKFFQSQETIEFINNLNIYFQKVRIFKPKASIKNNNEMFLIAKKYLIKN